MIAIATGWDKLDAKTEEVFLANGIEDIQVVHYREFFLEQRFDTIVMSKNLVGHIELEYLFLNLRENNTRVIYLTNESDKEELKLCFMYGIYDLVFDPITPELILKIYETPKTFADVKRTFLAINGQGGENTKANDVDKLMKMNKNRAPIVQNDFEDFTPVKSDMERFKENLMEDVSQGISAANEEGKRVQSVDNNFIKRPQAYREEEEERYDQTSKEISPLSEQDFPKDKRRIIKETHIQSNYQVPHDYKKTIVLISPESTGKTTIAVNMAWYFNKKGIKTTLIDTDIKKKDVYYHFPIEAAGCLSKIGSTEEIYDLGIEVDRNLRVYTEYKDINVELGIYDLIKLVTSAKRSSQIVIVDLDYSLEQDIVRNILEIADNILIVVDQKVTTLNRVPEELYMYREQLQNVDLIVNRYYNIKYLEKERIATTFFQNIELYNGKFFDINVNYVHTIFDDARSVLQGLADRMPTIQVRDNLLEKDIKSICDRYYLVDSKNAGKMF